MQSMTPMQQQYQEARAGLPKGTLLLFRLGDFYEFFGTDAEDAAKILGITLTQRHGEPMAGIPCKAADSYVPKLLAAGKRVAFCDQKEPAVAGKLVKRGITRILTPGTALEDIHQASNQSSFVLSLQWQKKYGLVGAFIDVSAGRLYLLQEKEPQRLLSLLSALDLAEILLPQGEEGRWQQEECMEVFRNGFLPLTQQALMSPQPLVHFYGPRGLESLCRLLGVGTLQGLGVADDHPALGCVSALLHYVEVHLQHIPQNIHELKVYNTQETLLVDPTTLRHLNIFHSGQTDAYGHTRTEGSLLHAMDATLTAPGRRLLREYLATPSQNLGLLQWRQDCVGDWVQDPEAMTRIRDSLKHTRDLERLLSRLQNRLYSPRDLGSLRETLAQLPALHAALAQTNGHTIAGFQNRLGQFQKLLEHLEVALNETLPQALSEGGTIQDGYDETLDHHRQLSQNSKSWMDTFEAQEQAQTGIRTLRIRYNGALGYFIEIPKSQKDKIPEHYVHRQSMTQALRFMTPELQAQAQAIAQAEFHALEREQLLFKELVAQVLEHAPALRTASTALAQLDVFAGWAYLARRWNYCRPELNCSDCLDIQAGRHPVVEQALEREHSGLKSTQSFVPNDCRLSSSTEQILLLTGPNMAGKSTYIRQVALITFMAQVGAWVPSTRCQLGIVDRIMARIGASDDLARGQSTFMVEMMETAAILNTATQNSLVILDEVGRGTSTYDGLSLAWAILEALHGDQARGPRTLFATHYHELTQLEKTLPCLHNASMAVREDQDSIVFLRQVIPGATNRSYGLHVARLAGIPQKVLTRAQALLDELEAHSAQVQSALNEPQHAFHTPTLTPKPLPSSFQDLPLFQ